MSASDSVPIRALVFGPPDDPLSMRRRRPTGCCYPSSGKIDPSACRQTSLKLQDRPLG
jgi:hypothetical protein